MEAFPSVPLSRAGTPSIASPVPRAANKVSSRIANLLTAP
jgi:hypothetical protein